MRIIIAILTLNCLLGVSFTADAEEPAVTARLLVSNPSPYLGEEIDLLLEVTYHRHPGGRTRFNWPNLDNFVSADQSDIRSQRSRDSQNRLVETLYRRIRPIKTGKISLQNATVRAGRLNITLAPLTLRVRPLPITGRPDQFNNQVGTYRLKLAADGSGPREISLHIYDSNQLAPLPVIRSWPDIGGELIRLETRTRPTEGEGREHILRYFFTPEHAETGVLRFSLSFFDPQQHNYLEIETGPVPESSVWPLVGIVIGGIFMFTFIAALFWFKRRPGTIDGCLEYLCRRPVAGLARENIQKQVDCYLDPDGREALQRYWESEDKCRFNRNQSPDRTDIKLTTTILRQHLWKAIDKQQNNP